MSIRSETRWPVRLHNGISTVVGRGKKPTLHADELMQAAAKNTGLNDFGDPAFEEGFRVLVDAVEREGMLHPFGRGYAKSMFTHILSNRLHLQARWSANPSVLTNKVERPIVIAAPPRTGTTLLFNLLALDDKFRWLESWEAANPGIDKQDAAQVQAAQENSAKNIKLVNYLRPDLKTMHKLGTKAPEECVPLLSNSFESDFFTFAYPIKSYMDWYKQRDRSYTYGYYRQQLQLLQAEQPKKRWLLKAPSHLFSLSALFKAFPDAAVIQTHRDPTEFAPSWAKMRYAFRAMGSYSVDEEGLGRYVTNLLYDALTKLIELRKNNDLNIIDVLYADLLKDPLTALETVYERIGETFTPEKRQRAEQYLLQNPKNKEGKNTYSLNTFHLSESEVREKFKFYTECFGIAPSPL